MADRQREDRMADVVDALAGAQEAVGSVSLDDISQGRANRLYEFRSDISMWLDIFRELEGDARGDD